MGVHRVMRIRLMVVVAVLGFGAGLVLHGWSDEGGAAAPDSVTRAGGDRQSRPIRLIPADPGKLHRRAQRRSPTAGTAAAAVAPAPAPVAPALPPPAPAPAQPDPAPEATPAPQNDSQQPDSAPPTTFDIEG